MDKFNHRQSIIDDYDYICQHINHGQLNQLASICKRLVKNAEKRYHVTKDGQDLKLLLGCYDLVARYQLLVYEEASNEVDLVSFIRYHEKIVYLLLSTKEDLVKSKDEELKYLRNCLESICTVLYYASMQGYDKLFNSFYKLGTSLSRKLYMKTKLIIDEYYIILIDKMIADKAYYEQNYHRSLKMYQKAYKRLDKVYDTLEKESIKEDLIEICNQIIKECKILDKHKLLDIYKRNLIKIGG